MNCDYLVLLFLGLTNREPGQVGEDVSHVLREIGKHCHRVTPDLDVEALTQRPLHIDEEYKNYLAPEVQADENARRNNIINKKFGQIPFTRGDTDIFQVMNNNRIDKEIVRIPVNAILNLVSPDQLHTLYRRNHVFDVPSNDPSAPKQVALSGRLLETLLKAKQRMHEAINQGVLGAEHIFSGIHSGFGALNDLIGGGSHSIVDLIR